MKTQTRQTMRTTTVVTAIVAFAGVSACGGDDNENNNTSVGIEAPTDLQVGALEGGAHITWRDNSDNEAGFMIERMAEPADWMTIGMVPFDTTQYHDANLTAGTTYMYRVMAMPKSGGHETGKGAYSNEVEFMAPAAGSAGTGGTGGAGVGGSGHS